MTVRRARVVIIAAIAKKAEKAKSKTYTERQSRSSASDCRKSQAEMLDFFIDMGIINMVMKCAENRKIRTTSDRICMYGLAC